MTRIFARLAVRAARVLVVEVPGQWLARVELEQQILRRGWRQAWTPADADVLAVCGVPGPELAELVDRLWDQMPGPRVRADIDSSGSAGSALEDAATRLLDTPHHRTDARERAQKPPSLEPHRQMDNGDHEVMDHGGHGQIDHEAMGHGGHGQIDHEAMGHGGHGQMDHEAMGHGGHGQMDHEAMGHGGHGGMDMAPEGIALAQGGEDRDGLEMDVLHLPLGPALPFWPAGLVLRCSLQGDVVVEAAASVIDGQDHETGAHGSQPGGGATTAPEMRCDSVMALLALVGARGAAASARQARDALLRGDRPAARDALERVHRTVRRSWLLRWSLRGVLSLGQSDLARHGLPEGYQGDAYDRLLSTVERIRVEIGGGSTVAVEAVVPLEIVPHLVTGSELATVRLAVASLGLEPFATGQEVKHA
ncbi:hypothetical protein [Brachybacterium sp. P6-10-X1]|uniref:hypothetical protein n=1 Tax=Brachybacterium sp. P6-10-X1 TaxID=1903186 RepID=UPI0012FB9209|nr:hypothetical protein [Brachybacterium sp. P6-10-X1]